MKQQLIKKAENLFLRYGIRSVSMDDIARELGVSKKTLYLHIENKTDLVEQVFDGRFGEEKEVLEYLEQQDYSAIEGLMRFVKYMIDRLRIMSPSFRYDLEKYYPSVYNKMTNCHASFFLDHMITNIIKGKEEGLYRTDVDEQVVARFFMVMGDAMGHDELFPIKDYPLGELVAKLFEYHLYGVVSPKGLKEFLRLLEEGKE